MNTSDVMKYGHLWVLKHLEGLSEEEWAIPGVCGVWSVKEILAHLASFELMLVDLLDEISGSGNSTPTLDQFRSMNGDAFNAAQVGQRKRRSVAEIREEYQWGQAQVMNRLDRIPSEKLRQAGMIPWYGMEYDLEDFIAYSFYGHKREHAAQINVFRDQLARGAQGVL